MAGIGEEKPISTRKRFLALVLIMIAACTVGMAIMAIMLYRNSLMEYRGQLQATAQSQARLIEAVARYDAGISDLLLNDDPDYNSTAATLSQIIDAHEHYEGFGEMGEFALARREEESIVFLLSHRYGTVEHSVPLSFDSEVPEPMRRALDGQSGTVIALDYRGDMVVAAYEPVAVLNLGIVAKISLAEIRAPFIRSALSASAIALLLILAGTALFFRIANPIIARLEAYSRDLEKEVEERKRAEKDLRQFEHIVSSSTDLLALVDKNFVYISVNKAYLKAIGKTRDEMVGHSASEIFGEEFFGTIMKPNADRCLAGETVTYQAWFELPAQGRRFMEVVYSPYLDLDGKVLGFMVSGRDITKQQQADDERLSLERQVQQAQKLESLGVLAGGIAHDFNNILMAILGNADLALHELSPHAPSRGKIKEIEKAARRAAELAKQMLAYSGKGRFVIEPIDLNEFVEEMTHLLEVSISKKAVLKYNFADNLPTFDGDATQIRQVIMNLIINASEAIGERSGVIALSTGAMNCDRAYLDSVSEILRAGLEEPLAEGLYVYFEVADTGGGMDAETIEKIFDPFFTTKFTGRGLGMSATLGIVRGHRGAIKIYSEVGKGTTIKIMLPANELPEEQQEPAPGKGETSADVPVPVFSGTILVADDEETVCVVTKRILEHMGWTVLTASDGREAVEIFRERADEIVCVLLDLTMPVMDGAEAFHEMRRIDADVKVILCSGYNMEDATERFAGKGLAGFIQKPYTIKALREKLTEIL